MTVKFTIIWLDKESAEDGKYTCRVKVRHILPMLRSGRQAPKPDGCSDTFRNPRTSRRRAVVTLTRNSIRTTFPKVQCVQSCAR